MGIPKEQKEKLSDLLLEGFSVAEAARQLEIPQKKAYAVARAIGWNRSMRKKDVCRNISYDCLKKASLSTEEILERYDNGESQTSIAKASGVSRQRIQQLVTRHGRLGQNAKIAIRKQLNTPKVALIKVLMRLIKNKQKEGTEERRYKELFEKFKEARIWWEQDVEIKEIAHRLDMKVGSLNWYIGRLRKKYGWFPNREPFGYHRIKEKLSEEEKRMRIFNQYKELIPLWQEGVSQIGIAKILGWNKSKVSWGVHHLRKLGVDLKRRNQK